jgi:lipid-A-disaccharide synthase
MALRIAMVAGEASGDLLGAHLIAALKTHLPDARFVGIGGTKMEIQGFDAWCPAEKLAVRGYAEVLRHYREISGIRRRLLSRLLAEKPDVFIGIDAPDFNLWLERKLKGHGIPAIHYVSPSVWAWRRSRIGKIARSVTHLLALFPFEPVLYREHPLPVSYVGHPQADVIPMVIDKAAARERLGIDGAVGLQINVEPPVGLSPVHQLDTADFDDPMPLGGIEAGGFGVEDNLSFVHSLRSLRFWRTWHEQ